MGQIYVIMNNINGKCYVGQTVNTFKRRYCGNNWVRRATNDYLRNAVQKYGKDSFEIKILEDGIPEELLNEKESYWADKMNSYAPNGYNLRGCGDRNPHHVYTKLKNQGKRVVCSNGKEYPSINECSRDTGVSRAAIQKCLKKLLKHSRGLCFAFFGQGIPQSPPPESRRRDSKIECSNGCTYESMHDASRKTGVAVSEISGRVNGKINGVVRGLDFRREGDERSFLVQRRVKKGSLIVCSNGKTFNSLKEAAENTNTSTTAIWRSTKSGNCCKNGLKYYFEDIQ